MQPVRVLIACGSGIATSTVAQERVKEILAKENIPATISKGTVGQVQALQDGVDLILVTTRYTKPTTKPLVSVFGLISGINEEKTISDIVAACRQVLGQSAE